MVPDQPKATELIAQLRDVANRLDTRTISRSTFLRESGASEWQILKHFESWNALVVAAGPSR